MDLRTVVTISTLLVMTAASDKTTHGPPETSFFTQNKNTSRNCSCPDATVTSTTATTSSSAPVLGLLTIRWTNKCDGDVNLILYHPSNSSHVCHGSETNIQSLLRNVCKNQKGCKDAPRWDKGTEKLGGYYITELGAEDRKSCEQLRVACTVEADLHGELQAYKVVTALLCGMLLVMLLIRFTRPTVKALQKRLSDRRQNRWIGPTQSHSVSYHRGKTAVKNNDRENRLSYPALERLAVSDSREPSSNRNSDYNF